MLPTRITNELLKSGRFTHARPKIITFDAYNTLYCIKKPVMEQYCIVGSKYGIKANPEELTQRFPEVFNNIRRKYPLYGKHSDITAEQWWEYLIRDMFRPLDLPNKMVEEILLRFEGNGAYTVYSDVRELLETIKKKYPDVCLGIISNTDPIVIKLLENLELKKYFEGNIYLSYDLELKKPDAKLFYHAVSDMLKRNFNQNQGASLEEVKPFVWHIGDEEKTDLGGALQAGINGVLVDRLNSFGYFDETFSELASSKKDLSEDELSLRKVLNHSQPALQASDAVTDIIKIDGRRYVAANFKSLEALLF
ncbi:unnamed protein product [Kluyveromyces dobzhanskii CBS 2104]|uniref:WGS project CCBQ000000000 data, contig 00107 n=1 Tax=Kluyveromyces dobzhanskii CBS 2104 TaxID=1427455 RepID=A0A0A8KYW8_9SACH|nr:unnamed protein product [Kluyveromyces dobzhanskii CBS 2104]